MLVTPSCFWVAISTINSIAMVQSSVSETGQAERGSAGGPCVADACVHSPVSTQAAPSSSGLSLQHLYKVSVVLCPSEDALRIVLVFQEECKLHLHLDKTPPAFGIYLFSGLQGNSWGGDHRNPHLWRKSAERTRRSFSSFGYTLLRPSGPAWVYWK